MKKPISWLKGAESNRHFYSGRYGGDIKNEKLRDRDENHKKYDKHLFF